MTGCVYEALAGSLANPVWGSCHLPAVFARCAAHVAFEISVEVLRILESEPVCNLAHCLFGAQQLFLRKFYYLGLDEILRRAARFLLHEVAEIVGRKETTFGKVFDRRQPVSKRGAMEIAVQFVFKACENVEIGVASCVELPVVEAHAVVEQQFYVAAYQFAAVAVCGPFRLLPYFVEAVAEDGLLIFR